MDRQIVYPGSIPLDTDVLSIQRNTMIAIGSLAQVTLGMTAVADGLACIPTQPASMTVTVGPGCLTQFGPVDATPFGSLPALPATSLVRIGINLGSVDFALSAPSSPGQVITYLIQASFDEADATPVILPYYNAANPSQPYSGPTNTAAAQNTQRLQSVQLELKPGTATAVGLESFPAVDAGWVGLYAVTIGYGQSSIAAGNIAALPTAPFLPWKLPQLSPGTRNLAIFETTTQGSWTVPPGVSVVKVRAWGAGGAGGAGFGTAGGGGAGGGYCEGFYNVSPGQSFIVSVGNGGAGSGAGGGTSSFGSLASATGGQSGGSGNGGTGGNGGALAGTGFGSGFAVGGGAGGDSFGVGGTWLSGPGGSSYAVAGALAVSSAATPSSNGRNAPSLSGGGSGGVGSGLGGQGGAGLVLVEW